MAPRVNPNYVANQEHAYTPVKSNYYVSNREFYETICAWYDSGEEEVPTKAWMAVVSICERLSTRYNFVNYTYRDEMVLSAISGCIHALVLHKFDPKRTKNPFAYFTRIAFNEMVKVIKVEKEQSLIKHMSLEKAHMDAMLVGETLEMPEADGRQVDLVKAYGGKRGKKGKKDEKSAPSA